MFDVEMSEVVRRPCSHGRYERHGCRCTPQRFLDGRLGWYDYGDPELGWGAGPRECNHEVPMCDPWREGKNIIELYFLKRIGSKTPIGRWVSESRRIDG